MLVPLILRIICCPQLSTSQTQTRNSNKRKILLFFNFFTRTCYSQIIIRAPSSPFSPKVKLLKKKVCLLLCCSHFSVFCYSSSSSLPSLSVPIREQKDGIHCPESQLSTQVKQQSFGLT